MAHERKRFGAEKMNRFAHRLIVIGALLAMFSCTTTRRFQTHWAKLPAVPDAEGFGGSFAGVSHGALIVAGGANMVGDKWGTNFHKQWYDSVFVLENPQSQWRVAGKLPHSLGYGVSITTDDGVVVIGGSDSTNHYADVFGLSFENGELKFISLPALPQACANFCGAKVGNTIYVAGGLEAPSATHAMRTFWALDLAAPRLQWTELSPWPGPERMLAVAGVLHGEFYLVSGARLKLDRNGRIIRAYLKDAYSYSPAKGWRRIADVPRAVTAAPSPAISAQQLLIVSGDDGSKADLPLGPSHPGFSRDMLGYDAEIDRWSVVDRLPFGRATAPIVEWRGNAVIVMGEIRPRERTAEVWWRKGR
jgi:N-acetylneuraminate epimerase